jgi:hypothetical protein
MIFGSFRFQTLQSHPEKFCILSKIFAAKERKEHEDRSLSHSFFVFSAFSCGNSSLVAAFFAAHEFSLQPFGVGQSSACRSDGGLVPPQALATAKAFLGQPHPAPTRLHPHAQKLANIWSNT